MPSTRSKHVRKDLPVLESVRSEDEEHHQEEEEEMLLALFVFLDPLALIDLVLSSLPVLFVEGSVKEEEVLFDQPSPLSSTSFVFPF